LSASRRGSGLGGSLIFKHLPSKARYYICLNGEKSERLMQTVGHVYISRVKRLIAERIDANAEIVLKGNLTIDQYKRMAGIITGLNNALECFKDAEIELEEAEKASQSRDK
jgi:hypothetical protein